ncbi:DUF1190 family protein [Paraglaciecola chathamensis]|uniref:Integral membrane protein n=1 Tax=Paraglaciecola chathamensis S18K6 TaxID=1127672 RepID=A0AAV3V1D8_9ALTE|nr:DUF1190 family protein [Paraglaciecola chathamensis]GAC10775.1 hypothetical protein GCHA_2832 [Paraglaciecola chathamensis S18K6]
MTQRKRSSNINLASMRKGFSVKPLALGIAAVMLSRCGEETEKATVYTSVDDCTNQNPGQEELCKTAYQDALDEAQRTGPKYASRQICEEEFGANQCNYTRTESGSFFMPFMAGYMLSNLLSPRGYNTQPMFTSYSPYSSYRHRWMGADGSDYGDYRRRNMNVSKKAFKSKPSVSKTMSRGGFGSSVRAKSSWGSSSRKSSGWGG